MGYKKGKFTDIDVRGINVVWAYTGVYVWKQHSGVIVCSGEYTDVECLSFIIKSKVFVCLDSIVWWLLLTGKNVRISVLFSVLFIARFLERATAEAARQRLRIKRQLTLMKVLQRWKGIRESRRRGKRVSWRVRSYIKFLSEQLAIICHAQAVLFLQRVQRNREVVLWWRGRSGEEHHDLFWERWR